MTTPSRINTLRLSQGIRDMSLESRVEMSRLIDAAESVMHSVASCQELAQPITSEEWLDFLAGVGVATRALDVALSEASRDAGLGGAKSRLRKYFQRHPGEAVSAEALEAVAGIRAWPRRIRELRADGMSISQLGSGDQYIYLP